MSLQSGMRNNADFFHSGYLRLAVLPFLLLINLAYSRCRTPFVAVACTDNESASQSRLIVFFADAEVIYGGDAARRDALRGNSEQPPELLWRLHFLLSQKKEDKGSCCFGSCRTDARPSAPMNGNSSPSPGNGLRTGPSP